MGVNGGVSLLRGVCVGGGGRVGAWGGGVLLLKYKFVLSRNLGYTTTGDRQVAKRSSDPRVAYPEVKVQVRDLVRFVGIVAPFTPLGVGIRGKFVLSSPRGKWEQETCAGCPQQGYATGEPGKVQGPDRLGVVEGSCRYRARGSTFGEKSFYRETWGTRRGDRQVAKRSSDPRVAYPRSKFRYVT